MTNNHTEDFYIEVLRARSLSDTLTEDVLIDRILDGSFEYKAFGISKEVAVEVARKAFKFSNVSSFGGDPLGYQSEGNFISSVTQVGLSDVPKTITFGAGGLSPNGNINIGANGVIEVLKPGYYLLKQRFRVGRSGASGVSSMFLWAEVSSDGGSTWDLVGNSVDVNLNSSIDTIVFFDVAPVYAPAGLLFRNRFARSSTGDNSGDLKPSTPSTALANLGVPIAPSAQLTAYTLR